MSILKVVKALLVAIPFVIPLALLAEAEGVPGKEKKAMVVADLKRELEKISFEFPAWLDKFVDPLLGLVVDVIVFILNKNGFFGHGEDTSLDI